METARLKTAVAFLKDKQSFTVGDLRLGITNDIVSVTGWSQYSYIEDLNKHRVLKELNEIKELFNKMNAVSTDLRNFIADKEIEFDLYFDDCGKGSIVICSEKNGIIKWEMELKK